MMRFPICLMPITDDVDLKATCRYLREVGGFSFVGVDSDGTIDMTVGARHVDEAEKLALSSLDDEDRPKFRAGHPPP